MLAFSSAVQLMATKPAAWVTARPVALRLAVLQRIVQPRPKSLKRKSCWRSRAARLESDQPKLNFICRYFKISMAINAVQIRVFDGIFGHVCRSWPCVAQPICGECATAQGKQRGVAQLFQTECATATGVLGCHASRRRAKKMAWEIRGLIGGDLSDFDSFEKQNVPFWTCYLYPGACPRNPPKCVKSARLNRNCRMSRPRIQKHQPRCEAEKGIFCEPASRK